MIALAVCGRAFDHHSQNRNRICGCCEKENLPKCHNRKIKDQKKYKNDEKRKETRCLNGFRESKRCKCFHDERQKIRRINAIIDRIFPDCTLRFVPLPLIMLPSKDAKAFE